MIPKSGGEYAYFFDGLGSLHPFWGPLPAFLYSWLSVLLLSPAGTAAGCMSCATYTISPLLSSFDICLENEDKELLLKLTAILYLGTNIYIQTSMFITFLIINNNNSFRTDNGAQLLQRRLDDSCEQFLQFSQSRSCQHCYRLWRLSAV